MLETFRSDAKKLFKIHSPANPLWFRLFGLMLGFGLMSGSLSYSADVEKNSLTSYPSDIDPQSGSRLPLPAREDLDDLAKKSFDRANTPGGNIAGLRGPAGIRLYSPTTAFHHAAISEYLRKQSGIPPRAREIAILITARELDSQFEWAEHEPVALKVGVSPEIIDVIKHARSTQSLNPEDALIIELGRQMWTEHKVKSDVFAQLKAIYGPQKLIDITLLMGYYGGTAALLSAVDMQLQPGKTELLPVPKPKSTSE
jgi:4-carboxymuconolactone decarboxylase